jgi:hypothetical protein
MRVPELVRREAPTDAGRDSGAAELSSGGGPGPVPASRESVNDAEQRTDRKLDPQLEPRAKLLPGPFVHADRAPSSALATRNSTLLSRWGWGVGWGERLDAVSGDRDRDARVFTPLGRPC